MKRLSVIGTLLISILSFAQNEESIASKSRSVFLAHDFFLTLSGNYEQTYPIREKTHLGFRVGLGRNYGDLSTNAIAGVTSVFGKTKNYFELQFGYEQPFQYSDAGPDPPMFALMAGYRRVSEKGVLFKVYGEFLPDFFNEPDSWGHLPFIGFALGKSWK